MRKIAAIQMCSSHVIEENLATASRLIKEASDNGAKLIVLPEMWAIMGASPKDKVRLSELFGRGLIQDFLSQQSIKHGVWNERSLLFSRLIHNLIQIVVYTHLLNF